MIDDVEVARAFACRVRRPLVRRRRFRDARCAALARSHGDVGKGWALFEAIETRFASQVRVSIPLAGVTGLWMAVPVCKASHQRAAGMASTTASPIVISPSLMTSA